MATLTALESKPQFSNYSYGEQVQIRGAYAQDQLFKNPQFQQYSPDQKNAIVNSILYRPPVLKDKALQKQVSMLWDQAKAGDKDALKRMEVAVVYGKYRDQSLIVNTFDKFLISPIFESIEGKSIDTPEVEQRQITLSNEGTKVLNSFDTFLSQDTQRAKTLGIYKTIASIGGALTDFAIMYGTLAGTSVAGARGIGKLAQIADKAIAAGAKTSGRLFLARLAGESTHAGVTAVMGVAREWGREAIQDGMMQNYSFQEMAIKSSKWFGEYFVGDLAINWMTGVLWPFIKVGAKGGGFVKGYGDVSQVWKGLNPPEFKKLTQLVLSGDNIPADQLARLPKQLQIEAITTNVSAKLQKNVQNLTSTDAAKIIAKDNGFNMMDSVKGGWDINPIGGDIPPIHVTTVKQVNDYMVGTMVKKEMNPIFKQQDVVEFGKRAAGAGNAEMRAIITGEVTGKAAQNIDVLTRLAAPVGGKFQKSRLESFIKTFAKGNGAGTDTIKNLRVIDGDGVFKIISKDGDIATITKGALNSTEEVAQIKVLTEKLGKLVPEGIKLPLGKELIAKYSNSLVKQNIFTSEWMAHVVDMDNGILNKVGKQWIIQSKVNPNVKQTFDSIEELGEYLIRKNISVEMLKQSAELQGMKLVGNSQSKTFKVTKGGKLIATGDNMDSIVDQVPTILPKIDSIMGPKLTIIDDTGILGVRFTKEAIAVADQQKLLNFLDKFRKNKAGGATFTLTGGSKGKIQFHNARKQFEVIIPDIGERATFTQINKAREYLDGGWKDFKNVQFSAMKKGYKMDYKVGKWLLYTDTGTPLTFNTFDEMTAALKKVPMPEWAPELSSIPEELTEAWVRPDQDFFKLGVPDLSEGPLEYSVRAQGGALWSPPKSNMERLVKEGGNPEALETFNEIEAARIFVKGQEGQLRKLSQSVFVNDRGKVINRKTRTWMARYGEATDDAMRQKIIEDAALSKVEIGEEEITALTKLRTLYGETETEGSFAYFGTKLKADFVYNYFPKIKKYFLDNPKKPFTDGGQREFLAQVWGNKVPREVDAFFKHARTSEILDAALDDDPLSQLYRYMNIGLKEKYMGPLIEKAKDLASLKSDPVMKNRMFNYLAQISGLPQGDAQQIIRKVTPQILRKLGVAPTLTNDITSWFMSLGYSASMGFRPWLPIRNMNQIWTTLAMRMQDNGWVKKALKDVAGKDGVEIFDTLRKKGVVTSSLPLYGVENLDISNLLGKIQNASLKMYKNSDDFTRAVAYQASTLKFNDALERVTRLNLTPDEFLHMSGVSQMDPSMRGSIMKLMNEGNNRGARDMFASEIVNETMFPYRAGMAPGAFKGTIGKMFGMMGHYSAYYVDNIRRSLKYMTTAEKVAAGTLMVGNSMALYGAFRAIGVKADNFRPWEPAIFTGGPSWEIMQQMLGSAGTGPEGKQSRAALLGIKIADGKLSFNPLNSMLFKWSVPGSFELLKMRDAVKLANDGDSWGSFLTSVGAPYSPDWEVLQ